MAPEEEGTVFVGNKPRMNYVSAVITQFLGGTKKVRIKARGRFISKAVDVVEAIRNKFMPTVKVESINIDTEELEREGKKVRVSTIDILLTQE